MLINGVFSSRNRGASVDDANFTVEDIGSDDNDILATIKSGGDDDPGSLFTPDDENKICGIRFGSSVDAVEKIVIRSIQAELVRYSFDGDGTESVDVECSLTIKSSLGETLDPLSEFQINEQQVKDGSIPGSPDPIVFHIGTNTTDPNLDDSALPVYESILFIDGSIQNCAVKLTILADEVYSNAIETVDTSLADDVDNPLDDLPPVDVDLTEPGDWDFSNLPQGVSKAEAWYKFVEKYDQVPEEVGGSFVSNNYQMKDRSGNPVPDAIDNQAFNLRDISGAFDTFQDVVGGTVRGVGRSAHADNLGSAITNVQRGLWNLRLAHSQAISRVFNRLLAYTSYVESKVDLLSDFVTENRGLIDLILNSIEIDVCKFKPAYFLTPAGYDTATNTWSAPDGTGGNINFFLNTRYKNDVSGPDWGTDPQSFNTGVSHKSVQRWELTDSNRHTGRGLYSNKGWNAFSELGNTLPWADGTNIVPLYDGDTVVPGSLPSDGKRMLAHGYSPDAYGAEELYGWPFVEIDWDVPIRIRKVAIGVWSGVGEETKRGIVRIDGYSPDDQKWYRITPAFATHNHHTWEWGQFSGDYYFAIDSNGKHHFVLHRSGGDATESQEIIENYGSGDTALNVGDIGNADNTPLVAKPSWAYAVDELGGLAILNPHIRFSRLRLVILVYTPRHLDQDHTGRLWDFGIRGISVYPYAGF